MTARSGKTTAMLKFYISKDGYGFASSPKGDLYIGKEVAGRFEAELQKGVELVVAFGAEPKGLRVTEIISIGDEVPEFFEGEVKSFNRNKGYGFVVSDDFAEDLFLHQSVVEKVGLASLAVGQRLRFAIGDRNGRQQISLIELSRHVSNPKKSTKAPKKSKSSSKGRKGTSWKRHSDEARV